MEERRTYMRFNVLLDALCRTSGALKKLKVHNFSREGIGVLSKKIIPEGEDVELELAIPGDNIPVIVTGQIAWTNEKKADSDRCEGGIKLAEMDNVDRSRILNHIYKKWMLPKT